MAITRTPLQGINPSAPQPEPERESWWEFTKKAATQSALQGLVQFGVQTGVEYATDDLKTEREINVAKARIDSERDANLELSSREGLRTLATRVNEEVASIDNEDQLLSGLMQQVGMSQRQGSTTTREKPAVDMGAMLKLLNAEYDVKKGQLEQTNKNIDTLQDKLTATETASASEGDSPVMVRNKARDIGQEKKDMESRAAFQLRAMKGIDKLKSIIKEVETSGSGARNPRQAMNLIRQRVMAHRKALLVQRNAVLRNWQDEAQFLTANIPNVDVNARALRARIESRQTAHRAKMAEVYAHERLRETMGDGNYERWLNRGGLNSGQPLPPIAKLPWSKAMMQTNAEFKHHFSPTMRQLYGLDDIKTTGTVEYMMESYIKGTGTIDPKWETNADKEDRITRKAVGVQNMPDIDPAVLKEVQNTARVPPMSEAALTEGAYREAPLGKFSKYSRKVQSGVEGELPRQDWRTLDRSSAADRMKDWRVQMGEAAWQEMSMKGHKARLQAFANWESAKTPGLRAAGEWKAPEIGLQKTAPAYMGTVFNEDGSYKTIVQILEEAD